jgi:hypothetical protein
MDVDHSRSYHCTAHFYGCRCLVTHSKTYQQDDDRKAEVTCPRMEGTSAVGQNFFRFLEPGARLCVC